MSKTKTTKLDAAIAALNCSVPGYTDASDLARAADRERGKARDAMDRDGKRLASEVRRIFLRAIPSATLVEVTNPGYLIDHTDRPWIRKAYAVVKVHGRYMDMEFRLYPRSAAGVRETAKKAALAFAAWEGA